MALDSLSKRLSTIHLGAPWRGLLPIPDGTVGHGDRQQFMFLSSAVLSEESTLPTVFGDLTTLFADYLRDLRDANLTEDDSNTLVANDRPNVLADSEVRDDENTMYAQFLSP